MTGEAFRYGGFCKTVRGLDFLFLLLYGEKGKKANKNKGACSFKKLSRSKQYEEMCRKVCTPDEYRMLRAAFFNKKRIC